MKKEKSWFWIGGVTVLVIAFGLGIWQGYQQTSGSMQTDYETESGNAMGSDRVYRYTKDHCLFIDEAGSPFGLSWQEEPKIYDEEGKEIGEAELQMGDQVEIIFSGGIMEVYPVIYDGVSAVKIIKKATETEAEEFEARYKELMAEFYTEPDSSEKPVLQIEYSENPMTTSVGMTNQGGYSWSLEKEDGQTEHEIADAAWIGDWKDLVQYELTESGIEGKLLAGGSPDRMSAVRWSDSIMESGEILDGEEVTLEQREGEWYLTTMEKGYVYLITVFWGEDYVEYGFWCQ